MVKPSARGRVAFLHYSYPPVLGGVEVILRSHARLFSEANFNVRVVAGEGARGEDDIEFIHIPELSSRDPQILDIKREIAEGRLPLSFESIKNSIRNRLLRLLRSCNCVFIHNVMTMHFNLPLTAALAEVVGKLSPRVRFYFWCHDLAAIDPRYGLKNLDRYPLCLISRRIRGANYVAISDYRRRQLARLLRMPMKKIRVVPDGIDIWRLLRIPPRVKDFARKHGLLLADLVMIFPSRVLRRKNFEMGIRIAGELKRKGLTVRFLLTGPPDVHNPAARAYFRELKGLRKSENLRKEVIFLAEEYPEWKGGVSEEELHGLYHLSDILFVTSTQEGFGIPLIEAAAMKLPVVCTRLPSLSEVAGADTLLFSPDDSPRKVARLIMRFVDSLQPRRFFRRAIRTYAWDVIFEKHLRPLAGE